MKQLICEICESTDFVKQDGLFVCQTCGIKYSLEEVKNLMSVTTIKNDKSDEIQNFFKRVLMHLEEGKWKSANDLLDQILNKDPENAQAYVCKLMVEVKARSEDKLLNLPISFDGNINYKRIMQFGDAQLKNKFLEHEKKDSLIGNIAHTSKPSVWNGIMQVILDENYNSFGYKENAEKISKAIVLDGVEVIPYSAFNGCTNLTDVTIPDSVRYIERHAFFNCTSLTEITIPNSVTSIKEWAFSGCSSLKNIKLSDSLTTIGDYAFDGCSSLEQIVIPDSVTTIGRSVFSECDKIKKITIPSSVTSIEGDLFGYGKAKTIYYAGTTAQWEKIEIRDKEYFKGVVCSDTLELLRKADEARKLKAEEAKRKKLEEEAKKAEKLRIAKEAEEQKLKQKAIWRSEGLCQICGGAFKGLLIKECSVCGIRKNY